MWREFVDVFKWLSQFHTISIYVCPDLFITYTYHTFAYIIEYLECMIVNFPPVILVI